MSIDIIKMGMRIIILIRKTKIDFETKFSL